MTTVTVELADLAKLADLVCDSDNRKKPPTLENIEQCHDLIIKMAGEHVGEIYSLDDEAAT